MSTVKEILAPTKAAATGLGVSPGSPFRSLVALGLIEYPAPKHKGPGGWNRGTAKPKTATMCAHHSCRRESAPGGKLCEHHLNLNRARWNRWAEKHT